MKTEQTRVNRQQCLANAAFALEEKANCLTSADRWQDSADYWLKAASPENIDQGAVMQDLLDQARNTRFGADFGNPWKWDYENETWSALDSDGVLWTSDEDDDRVAVRRA